MGFHASSPISPRGCALLCFAVVSVFVVLARGGDRIDDDEGVKRYGLRNGLEVILVPSDSDARMQGSGEMLQLWLSVRAGSIDEGDDERGAASLVSRLVRGGIDGRAPEEFDAIFVAEGEAPAGEKQARGAYVMLDQTFYTGQAPVADAGQIGSLLAYYARVLEPGSWALTDEDFEHASGGLRSTIEDAFAREAGMRSRQRWLERLFGDGAMGTRLDLPELDEIDRLTPADAEAFATRTYRASRATLLVVGDTRGVDLERLIADTLGPLELIAPGGSVDPLDGLDGEQIVFEQEPGWEEHIVALLWAGPLRGLGSERGVCDEHSLREWVIKHVGGEVISQRIERLGLSRLGETQISFDRFEIARRVEAMQCVVHREGVRDADWRDSLEVIVSESDRLARDGAVREEILQARGAMLAGWHRDAESWRQSTSRERAREVHWMVMSGLPIINPVRWDQMGTRLMSSISDEEINRGVRSMLDVANAKVLVTRGGDPAEHDEIEPRIASFRSALLDQPLTAIDPHWMRSLGGDVLDSNRRSGTVEQITQHTPSGTWGATLSSGVRLWARPIEEDDRVELSATLWGSMFEDGSLSEGEIDAALLAWREPSSESRDAGWLAVFLETHGIRVRSERVMGGVQLVIRAEASQIDAAMELMTLLLDRPMIDPDAFAEWSREPMIRWGDKDPLDLALAELFCEVLVPEEQELTINDAQRVLARIVHSAQIEIGIAGSISAPEVIERGGELFGSISRREPERSGGCDQRGVNAGGECALPVPGDRAGIVVGMRGDGLADLGQLRAIVVASLVLDERLDAAVDRLGLKDVSMRADVVTSEALGKRWALIMRSRGGSQEQAEQIMDDVLRELDREGISEDEIESAKDRLVGMIERVYDSPRYWSVRMSMLGQQGRGVESIWSIREGYRGVSAVEASEALRAALRSPDRFRVAFQASGQ